METKKIYYEDPYQKEATCKIIALEEDPFSDMLKVILDQTVFYPEGGGQPADQGQIEVQDNQIIVTNVRMVDGEIIHSCKSAGEIQEGQTGTAKLDWKRRIFYMRIHSAGHLVHDVFMTMTKGLQPSKGSHGKKAFLEYEGEMDTVISAEELEQEVNKALGENLPIVTKNATYEELTAECDFVSEHLPKDKELRMIKIGDFSAMPDGGVHVSTTKEIGKIIISSLDSAGGQVVVKYRVQ